MKIFNLVKTKFFSEKDSERGQSLVLIALILVALLGFVGLAVDVGFVFARGSQLQAAVDAAALSAVSEVSADLITRDADLKVQQFLNANDVTISNTIGITYTTAASRSKNLGIIEYTVVVTRPVELFFLQLIYPDDVTLVRSATAAVNTLTDIYASRNVEEGIIKISTQGIFGPQTCTDYGDPFSPAFSPWVEQEDKPYVYTYRIMIPESYDEDIVRVEIFDPDSINKPDGFDTVYRSSNALAHPFELLPEPSTKFCGIHGGSADQASPCVLRTNELTLTINAPLYSLDQINPYWFVRIDENRGGGNPDNHGNYSCTTIKDGNDRPMYNPLFNTQTLYTLYYLAETPDGLTQRVDLARYLGNTGDNRAGDADHQTDMYWVSPGADSQGIDFPPNSNINPDVPGVSEVPTLDPNTSFEVNLNTDVQDIIEDKISGVRFLYLDVQSISGASENGFHIWAGPADYVNAAPAQVNTRNLYALNNPGKHHSKGIVIFALGRLPMNSIYKVPQGNIDDGIPPGVEIPLIYVGPEQAGTNIQIRLFDPDSGAEGPVTFFYDTIPESDWSLTFSNPNGIPEDPDGVTTRCIIGDPTDNCESDWINPPYELAVPGILDNCDYTNPNQDDCTPFYGGRLMARYIGGNFDSFGWEIQIEGLPYLVR